MTAIMNQVKSLHKQGFSVKVYSTSVVDPQRPHLSSRLPSREDVGNVTIKRYRPIFCILGYWVTPTIMKDLLTDEFDIIHAHSARSFQLDIAALVSWIRHRKLIVSPHGSLYSYGLASGQGKRLLFAAHNAILKLVFRRACKIIATSSDEENQFKRFGIDTEKIVCIPNFLDETQYAKLPPAGAFRTELGIGMHEKVILFLGRINEIKGLDVLLFAYSRIANNASDAWLVIVGPDGGYLSTIKKMLKGIVGSSHIVLAGPRFGVSKIQALVDSDFVVVPSNYESFGITAIEAFLSGKPVIASRVGNLPNLVRHNETGLLFDKGNVNQLAERLEWALENPKKLELMGDRARQLVLNLYSAQAVENALALLLSE